MTPITPASNMNLDEERASDIHRCFNKSFDLHYSSDPDNPRTSAGVAFIINKGLIAPDQVTVKALIPGRAAVLTLTRPDNKKTTIINIYAPVEQQKQPEFWNQLERRKTRMRISHPDFLLGDFNITEDLIDRSPPHPDNHAARDSLRRIRHAEHHVEIATLFEWNAGPTAIPTDHWMVSVKFAPKDAPDIGKGRWTWPLQSLKDADLIKKVVKRGIAIQESLDKFDQQETNRDETNPQRQENPI